MIKSKQTAMCKVFHCDHRGDRYCCYHCPRKQRCQNHCKNHPEKCGLSFDITERSKQSDAAICNGKS